MKTFRCYAAAAVMLVVPVLFSGCGKLENYTKTNDYLKQDNLRLAAENDALREENKKLSTTNKELAKLIDTLNAEKNTLEKNVLQLSGTVEKMKRVEEQRLAIEKKAAEEREAAEKVGRIDMIRVDIDTLTPEQKEWKFLAEYKLYLDGECVFAARTKETRFYCELENVKVGSKLRGTMRVNVNGSDATYDFGDLSEQPITIKRDTMKVSLYTPNLKK